MTKKKKYIKGKNYFTCTFSILFNLVYFVINIKYTFYSKTSFLTSIKVLNYLRKQYMSQ